MLCSESVGRNVLFPLVKYGHVLTQLELSQRPLWTQRQTASLLYDHILQWTTKLTTLARPAQIH